MFFTETKLLRSANIMRTSIKLFNFSLKIFSRILLVDGNRLMALYECGESEGLSGFIIGIVLVIF